MRVSIGVEGDGGVAGVNWDWSRRWWACGAVVITIRGGRVGGG